MIPAICILVRELKPACEAKHPLRNFIFNAIFHSVDSIFCLITTFPPSSFLSALGWNVLMKNLSPRSAYADSPDWVAVSCFERKGMKAISDGAEWISISPFLTNAFHLRPCQREEGYQSRGRPPPKTSPSTPSHIKTERARGGRWIFKAL